MRIRYRQLCRVQCQASEFFKGLCDEYSPRELLVEVTQDESAFSWASGNVVSRVAMEIVSNPAVEHLLLEIPEGVRKRTHAFFCPEHRAIIEAELKR